MSENRARPETEFKVGAVRVTVWANERLSREGAAFRSRRVLIERTYKHNNEFKTTGSLEINDIPKAIMALWKAYDFLQSANEKKDKPDAMAPDYPPAAVWGDSE